MLKIIVKNDFLEECLIKWNINDRKRKQLIKIFIYIK
jgi:hypothetical protein